MKLFLPRYFLLFISFLTSTVVLSQQDSQYSQYMYNTVAVNPAYAGSRGVTSIFLMHRNQWVGLDGAPVTNVFSVNKSVANSALGYGISVVNDRIGVSDDNTVSADVSYSIPLAASYKLSFGIKASANWLSVDYSRMTIRDPNDIILSQQNEIDNQFSPNVGVGVYLHSNKNYVGVSIPHFLETKRYDDNISSTANDKMHFYFIAGSVFDLNSDWKFKPALLTKLVQGAPLQIDVSANFLFNDKFTFGAGYRFNAAVTALVGFQVTKAWQIGYAYDAETTRLANYNSGSHEIFLRLELFSKYDKIVSPRFF
ncbi:type IX secretion system membrane protein PorP/SprF [Flavobacterium antarcticum]|uniref:PorP/SprF family type IX secretion system membrane protein n=1 Tax=Flavobacterium antarcticum TaxID=271155 RepID=UPI000A051078|nr:type IX secretion system membrane protein PorP/SprF [Flavobacterium antarcticum]